MFSPIQKRIMEDSMIESRILPCDRETLPHTNSPFTRKLKDGETTVLNTSFLDTDSIISSSMCTSESFYDSTFYSSYETSPFPALSPTLTLCRAGGKPSDVDINKETSKTTLDQSNSPSFPKLRSSRKRDVDWSDRGSIRLSIEYPKYAAGDVSSKFLEKADITNYFKICFATDFSEDEEDDEEEEKGDDDQDKEEEGEIDENCEHESKENAVNPLSTRLKPLTLVEKKTVKIRFLSDFTQQLIGEIETDDGLFSLENLQKLTFSQVQLVLNDLMNLIYDKNIELMEALRLRDDLQLKKVETRTQLDNLSFQLHSQRVGNTPLCSPVFRPCNFTNAFDPHPTYRYPYNTQSSPPTLSLSPRSVSSSSVPIPNQSTAVSSQSAASSTPVSRFKSYLSRIFSSNRHRQTTAIAGRNGMHTHSF